MFDEQIGWYAPRRRPRFSAACMPVDDTSVRAQCIGCLSALSHMDPFFSKAGAFQSRRAHRQTRASRQRSIFGLRHARNSYADV